MSIADTTTPGADDAPGPYDTVTIRDVFAWFDTLRGWDIATHVEYEALRNVALARLDALEAARRDAEARAKRLNDALAEAEARAALQLDRAERLAQTILGLCEGDANDLEFELDLYPLDLYDQTGGEFVVPTNREAAAGRTARLRKALRIVAAIADERGKRLSPYYPDTLSEDAQSEMGLHPGDVRRMAGPQRGRELT